MDLVIPKKHAPPHPGEVISELYMKPLKLRQQDLADAMGISRVRLNGVLNGRRAITPDTAMRLAKVFDTSDALWLNMQTVYDLFAARNSPEARQIAKLRSLRKAS